MTVVSLLQYPEEDAPNNEIQEDFDNILLREPPLDSAPDTGRKAPGNLDSRIQFDKYRSAEDFAGESHDSAVVVSPCILSHSHISTYHHIVVDEQMALAGVPVPTKS